MASLDKELEAMEPTYEGRDKSFFNLSMLWALLAISSEHSNTFASGNNDVSK